ncbi:MAG TPA: hypothetical protein VEV41_00990 [Terriglobales bacterium]|nr:hypothetical protein [Terriglobales bacterium]
MPLMLLAAHAYSLRQSARRSLRAGDAQSALAAAKAAQKLHTTAQGGILEMVCDSAVAVAQIPSAAVSPAPTEAPERALRETQGASSPTPVHEENPSCPITRCRRAEIPFPVPWKGLCLSAAAALIVVMGYALGPHVRRN